MRDSIEQIVDKVEDKVKKMNLLRDLVIYRSMKALI